jgi:hypothetical protein
LGIERENDALPADPVQDAPLEIKFRKDGAHRLEKAQMVSTRDSNDSDRRDMTEDSLDERF